MKIPVLSVTIEDHDMDESPATYRTEPVEPGHGCTHNFALLFGWQPCRQPAVAFGWRDTWYARANPVLRWLAGGEYLCIDHLREARQGAEATDGA